MPTYQYACPDCGADFERVQKFTDEPVKKCPNCGKRKVYRVVSKVAVSFKGSGWYITDSKSNGKAANGKEDDKKTEEKTETVTEKTETKTGSVGESKETKVAESKTESKSTDSDTKGGDAKRSETKSARKDKKAKAS